MRYCLVLIFLFLFNLSYSQKIQLFVNADSSVVKALNDSTRKFCMDTTDRRVRWSIVWKYQKTNYQGNKYWVYCCNIYGLEYGQDCIMKQSFLKRSDMWDFIDINSLIPTLL